jgi:hypothetical protein
MRRILVSCAVVGVLALPAATFARASAAGRPGYVVVTKAVGNGGVNGSPVVTVIVRGFVLGRVSAEGEVRIFHLQSVDEQGGPQVTPGVSTKSVRWHGGRFTGKQYTGSNFRFRATGGWYRVVIRGAGVYLFAGGQGKVILQGSSYQHPDGTYSVNGGRFRSLPRRPVTRKIGRG